MSIRVMIAEDERLAREELAYLLQQESDVELLPSATNGRELLQLVDEYEPDVVFLDMKMPEMEGIQAARMLSSRKRQPLIVFSTAFEEYAVDAFKLNAIDYLLKPTEPNRLKETLERIRKRVIERLPLQPQSVKVSKLLIEENNRLIVVDPVTIKYAMRDDRVIQIFTSNETHTTKMTLLQLEEKLLPHSFFRTHKSYLVNLDYVSELEPWFNGAYNITLKGAGRIQIPVSRTHARDLLKLLEGK